MVYLIGADLMIYIHLGTSHKYNHIVQNNYSIHIYGIHP